jgi:hypothetical protein
MPVIAEAPLPEHSEPPFLPVFELEPEPDHNGTEHEIPQASTPVLSMPTTTSLTVITPAASVAVVAPAAETDFYSTVVSTDRLRHVAPAPQSPNVNGHKPKKRAIPDEQPPKLVNLPSRRSKRQRK